VRMLRELHTELGIPGDYGSDGVKPAFEEAGDLVDVGPNPIVYQASLIRRKLEAGQSVSEILNVNAAPGYSEHHTGRAIDIAVPDAEPLTEEFESSKAFAWLEKNAASFGFSMSYPRENRQGFVYEPWHWAKSGG